MPSNLKICRVFIIFFMLMNSPELPSKCMNLPLYLSLGVFWLFGFLYNNILRQDQGFSELLPQPHKNMKFSLPCHSNKDIACPYNQLCRLTKVFWIFPWGSRYTRQWDEKVLASVFCYNSSLFIILIIEKQVLSLCSTFSPPITVQ